MTMKEKVFKRVFLVVIDSFGVGAEPDWAEYGDDPSLNTALHVIDDRPSPSFLWSRGLGYLLKEEPIKQPSVVAKLQELSKGKDSTTGTGNCRISYDYTFSNLSPWFSSRGYGGI